MADVPAIQKLGTSVLLSGPGVLHALHLVARGIQLTESRDGITPPPAARELERVLRAAADELRMSPSRHRDVAEEVVSRQWLQSEEMSTKEVAAMAGVGARQVQRLATSFGGRRVGGRLVFNRIAVQAAIAEREASNA